MRARLMLITFSAVSAFALQGLSIKLSIPDDNTLRIVAAVENTGTETLRVINDPRGPLSPFPADSFEITNMDGRTPRFIGPLVKFDPRYAALVGDFTTLEPRQVVKVTHDLNSYNFTATGSGPYIFKLRTTTIHIIDAANNVVSLVADAILTTASLKGSKAQFRLPAQLDRRATFRSCSSAQQTQLNTAALNAQAYASESYSYLVAHTTSTPRFATWFGTYTAQKHSVVTSHFMHINSNKFSAYTYDCSCTDTAYAYVYPDSYGVVYLCSQFWAAPATGTDSKAGTLIHEASHFVVNGGTDDYPSGPTDGIFSASSHQGFAENTPPLP